MTDPRSLSDLSLSGPFSPRRAYFWSGAKRILASEGARGSCQSPRQALRGFESQNFGKHWAAFHAARSTCSRLMFQAIVTRDHSPRALSSPRMLIWRQPITRLMMPNTGSTVCLRSP